MNVKTGLHYYWWKFLGGVQTGCHGFFHFSSLTFSIFLCWLLIAGAVDLVSDANVEYVIPLWGVGISLVVLFISWCISHWISGMAQTYRFKQGLK